MTESKLLQIFVSPRWRTFWRSIVCTGTAQVRKTRSPFLSARRSEGGFGSSRDGGTGGPMEAQATRKQMSVAAAPRLCNCRADRIQIDYEPTTTSYRR